MAKAQDILQVWEDVFVSHRWTRATLWNITEIYLWCNNRKTNNLHGKHTKDLNSLWRSRANNTRGHESSSVSLITNRRQSKVGHSLPLARTVSPRQYCLQGCREQNRSALWVRIQTRTATKGSSIQGPQNRQLKLSCHQALPENSLHQEFVQNNWDRDPSGDLFHAGIGVEWELLSIGLGK